MYHTYYNSNFKNKLKIDPFPTALFSVRALHFYVYVDIALLEEF